MNKVNLREYLLTQQDDDKKESKNKENNQNGYNHQFSHQRQKQKHHQQQPSEQNLIQKTKLKTQPCHQNTLMANQDGTGDDFTRQGSVYQFRSTWQGDQLQLFSDNGSRKQLYKIESNKEQGSNKQQGQQQDITATTNNLITNYQSPTFLQLQKQPHKEDDQNKFEQLSPLPLHTNRHHLHSNSKSNLLKHNKKQSSLSIGKKHRIMYIGDTGSPLSVLSGKSQQKQNDNSPTKSTQMQLAKMKIRNSKITQKYQKLKKQYERLYDQYNNRIVGGHNIAGNENTENDDIYGDNNKSKHGSNQAMTNQQLFNAMKKSSFWKFYQRAAEMIEGQQPNQQLNQSQAQPQSIPSPNTSLNFMRQLQALRKASSSIKKQNKSLTQTNTSLQSKNQLSQQRIQQLIDQNRQLQSHIMEISSKSTSMLAKQTQLSTKLQKIKLDLQKQKQQYGELKLLNDQCEKDRLNCKKKLVLIQGQKKQLIHQQSLQKSQLIQKQKLKQKVFLLQKQLNGLKIKYQNEKQQFTDALTKKLGQQNEKSTTELTQLTSLNTSLSQKANQLSAQLQKCRHDHKQSLKQFNQQMSKLQDKIDSQKIALQEQSQELSKLKELKKCVKKLSYQSNCLFQLKGLDDGNVDDGKNDELNKNMNSVCIYPTVTRIQKIENSCQTSAQNNNQQDNFTQKQSQKGQLQQQFDNCQQQCNCCCQYNNGYQNIYYHDNDNDDNSVVVNDEYDYDDEYDDDVVYGNNEDEDESINQQSSYQQQQQQQLLVQQRQNRQQKQHKLQRFVVDSNRYKKQQPQPQSKHHYPAFTLNPTSWWIQQIRNLLLIKQEIIREVLQFCPQQSYQYLIDEILSKDTKVEKRLKYIEGNQAVRVRVKDGSKTHIVGKGYTNEQEEDTVKQNERRDRRERVYTNKRRERKRNIKKESQHTNRRENCMMDGRKNTQSSKAFNTTVGAGSTTPTVRHDCPYRHYAKGNISHQNQINCEKASQLGISAGNGHRSYQNSSHRHSSPNVITPITRAQTIIRNNSKCKSNTFNSCCCGDKQQHQLQHQQLQYQQQRYHHNYKGYKNNYN